MVKKKAPFIPLTIIVLGVGFIFVMNARSHPVDPEQLQRDAQAQAQTGQRPKDDPAKESESMKSVIAAKPPAKIKPDPNIPSLTNPHEAEEGVENPMLAPKRQQYKPVENSTSATPQWWKPK